MSVKAKRKADRKTVLVRAVSLTLAGLMLLSVVFAAVWQW